jgi:hypothetical protein
VATEGFIGAEMLSSMARARAGRGRGAGRAREARAAAAARRSGVMASRGGFGLAVAWLLKVKTARYLIMEHA